MTRKITATDFDFIYELYMHPEINPYLLYEIMDSSSFQYIFNDLLDKGIVYVYEETGNAIGMFKLVPLQYRCSHIAYLGGFAVHPAFAGKGYGKKLLQEIIQLGKELGLLRIELSAATSNHKAISIYEKVGFVKEGVLKKYTWLKSENKFLDEVMMAYLY